MEIKAVKISKSYVLKEGFFKRKKINVLDKVDISIKQGEIIALMGEAKGGKTTLVNLLSGNTLLDEGEIFVNNKKDASYLRANSVVISNLDNKLLNNESVYNNLVYYGNKLKMSELDIEKRIVDLKNVFEFEKVINNKISELSDLYLVKVKLAISVLNYPFIVFIDEAFNRLSVTNRTIVLKDLKRLNKEFKTTIVIASDNLDEVEKICKRIVVLKDGNIVVDGAFEDVRKKCCKNKVINITFNKRFNVPKGDFNIIEISDYSLVVEIDFTKCDFAHLISQFDVNTIVDISINAGDFNYYV